MNTQIIKNGIDKLFSEGEIPNGILSVRINDELVFRGKWGYSDIESKKQTEYTDTFRMMSMTKPVTAVTVMKLIEQGKLSLDDAVSSYLPEFRNMQVISDRRFEWKEKMNPLASLAKILLFNHLKPKTVPAEREFTIRDLLSHSSGLEQGVWGFIAMLRKREERISPKQICEEKYSKYYLDWQPGTMTSYSALAGFDVLVRLVEVVSGYDANEYFKKEIFAPLGMKDSSFFPDRTKLVKLYKHTKNSLVDVTGKKQDVEGFIKNGKNYVCGSGGLYSTIDDYERFTRMLCNNGKIDGIRFLKSETVELMHTEACEKHLEPEPGQVWGLGMRIRQDKERGKFAPTEGTYGWSGAFGTHFIISPADKLEAVWLTNISNAGGSGSKVSKNIEELIFTALED